MRKIQGRNSAGSLEVAQFAADEDEDVLEQVVGVGGAGDAGQIAPQPRLDAEVQKPFHHDLPGHSAGDR